MVNCVTIDVPKMNNVSIYTIKDGVDGRVPWNLHVQVYYSARLWLCCFTFYKYVFLHLEKKINDITNISNYFHWWLVYQSSWSKSLADHMLGSWMWFIQVKSHLNLDLSRVSLRQIIKFFDFFEAMRSLKSWNVFTWWCWTIWS